MKERKAEHDKPVAFDQRSASKRVNGAPLRALQRDVGNLTVQRAVQAKRPVRTLPWLGRIDNTWSAALRRTPSKDADDPHENTVADLPQGTEVQVIGSDGGWLRVRTTIDGTTGYVSQELVSYLRAASFQLAEVTVTAERPKSVDEIIRALKTLNTQLLLSKSVTRATLIARQIRGLLISLESAPISPTPKRTFVAGPIEMVEREYYYGFGFESLSDKQWREGWTAIYKLASGPFGIALDLCDVIAAPSDDERADLVKGILEDKAIETLGDKGPYVGKQLLRKGAPKALSKGTAISIKALGKAVPVAITAYELYKANTEGPSAQSATLEITAAIMAEVYESSDGRDGRIRNFGVIQGGAGTYCRLARQQRGPFPQFKDRKLAFELMANRIYERMRDIIAPKHLASKEAFYAFRKRMIDNAWNLVESAGGELEGRRVGLMIRKEEEIEKMEQGPGAYINYHKEGIVVPFLMSGGFNTGFDFRNDKAWERFGKETPSTPKIAARQAGLTNDYSTFHANDSITTDNFVNLMLGRFIAGVGPENFVFARDSKVSRAMAETPIVENVIREWYQENYEAVLSNKPLRSANGGSFGLWEQWDLLVEKKGILNIPQFVGSANVTVSPMPGGKELLVTIKNVTSATSGDYKKHFGLGTAPSFPKDTLNPERQQYTNISQTFEFTVKVDKFRASLLAEKKRWAEETK